MAGGTLLLSGLWPPYAAAVQYFLQAADYYGIPVTIVSGWRSAAGQDQLYRQGRTAAEFQAHTHKPLGGLVVTNAKGGESAHNYGLAVDIDSPRLTEAMQLAAAIGFGLVTGDPDHLEWPNWRSLLG